MSKRGRWWAVGAILTFIAFFMWGMKADAAELRLGIGMGINHHEGARYQEFMLTDNNRHWYLSATRVGNDDRHNYQYWRGCGGYRVNWRKETNFSPYMRLGACYFNEIPVDYVSDYLTYDLAIGFRILEIADLELIQHNSTGGRSIHNEGLDAIVLGLVFPFGSK